MIVDHEVRASDSPFIHSVYQARSIGGGSFTSTAESHWEIVVTRQKGNITFSIRGPETKASPAPIPRDAEFLGVIFEHGLYMPMLPGKWLADHEIHVPASGRRSFQLFGDTWEIPTFENVDTFVDRLLRRNLLSFDRIVADVLRGKMHDLSVRSIQRRFLHVTGLTYKGIQQIERAHNAVKLLQSGMSIAEAAVRSGYFDQAHLTHALRRYYGQTPSEIRRQTLSTNVAFLQDESVSWA
jgi:AraC-like DNA-binding protein